MEGWNYRVCKTIDSGSGETLYSIQEVYYEDGKPSGFCDADVRNWDTLENLKGTFELMQQAFDKPIIEDKG